MQSKTVNHNGFHYVLERNQTAGSVWQVYRLASNGRLWVARGQYQNNLIQSIKLGRFEPQS